MFNDPIAKKILKEHEVSETKFKAYFEKIAGQQPLSETYDEENDREFRRQFVCLSGSRSPEGSEP